MSLPSLGLNLAAMSIVEPFFYLKQAVRLNAQNANQSTDTSTTQHQDVIKLHHFELFPSNKLLTWALQLFVATALDHKISAVMKLDNGIAENFDTSINALTDTDVDESMVISEGPSSPASSLSAQSVSCYSCESEEERDSNGSDTSFSSLLNFDEDLIDNSIMSPKHVTSPLSVSVPHHKSILRLTNELIVKPIVSKNCTWQEETDQFSTDEEWDEYIDQLAQDLEREFQFNFEFSSENESTSRSSGDFECKEGEAEVKHVEEFISSQRRDDSKKSFDNLSQGEGSMNESECSNEIEETSKDINTQSHIIKLSDQEIPRIQLTSDERHVRVLRINPHLLHLFDWED